MTPHKCPVCEGKGRVDAAFYPDVAQADVIVAETGALLWTTCRACDGKGVVWAERVPHFRTDVPHPETAPYVPWPPPNTTLPPHPWTTCGATHIPCGSDGHP